MINEVKDEESHRLKKVSFDEEISGFEAALMILKDHEFPSAVCAEITAYIYGAADPNEIIKIKICWSGHKGVHLDKNKGILDINTLYGWHKPEDITKAIKKLKGRDIPLQLLTGGLDKNAYLCQHPNNIIYDGCTLNVKKAIYVKSIISGKTAAICNIDWGKSVESQICQPVQEQLGYLVESQRIIFAGKQLDKKRKVGDYNLSMNCTLHIV